MKNVGTVTALQVVTVGVLLMTGIPREAPVRQENFLKKCRRKPHFLNFFRAADNAETTARKLPSPSEPCSQSEFVKLTHNATGEEKFAFCQ